MLEKKHIAILGSTGTTGKEALRVIEAYPNHFQAEVLTSYSNAELLAEQALKYNANAVVIGDETKYRALKDRLFDEGIKVYCGEKALAEIVDMDSVDMVLNALVGLSGVLPTLRAIDAGKDIALANKESLVVAGELVTKAAREKGVNIYPVAPALSGIFQCLAGDFHNPVEKIYLTDDASPFRGLKEGKDAQIHAAQLHTHLNRNEAPKTATNSATGMAKAFETIEATWLFGLKPEQIEVILHPQSIVQSIVQFEDGGMKAQMGLPDIKLPIQYAMGFPQRLKTNSPRFNFVDYPELTFGKPGAEALESLNIAKKVLQRGGNMAAVLNAANEVAVEAFLSEKIGFAAIANLIESCIEVVEYIPKPSLEDYFQTDRETRKYAESLLTKFCKGQHVNEACQN